MCPTLNQSILYYLLIFSLLQRHPEPFFALAKELYPGQFKVQRAAHLLNIFLLTEETMNSQVSFLNFNGV